MALSRADVPQDHRARLALLQGIFILRHLRRNALMLPVLLFADLDDAVQIAFLESTIAPLAVIPSTEPLAHIATRMRGIRPSKP